MIHIWEYFQRQDNFDKINELFGEQFAQDLLKVDSDESWQGTVYYNLACVYALADKIDSSLKNIARALSLNPGLKEWSRQDSDLASIQDHPDFLALFQPDE
jgi:hypothetical protein